MTNQVETVSPMIRQPTDRGGSDLNSTPAGLFCRYTRT